MSTAAESIVPSPAARLAATGGSASASVSSGEVSRGGAEMRRRGDAEMRRCGGAERRRTRKGEVAEGVFHATGATRATGAPRGLGCLLGSLVGFKQRGGETQRG